MSELIMATLALILANLAVLVGGGLAVAGAIGWAEGRTADTRARSVVAAVVGLVLAVAGFAGVALHERAVADRSLAARRTGIGARP